MRVDDAFSRCHRFVVDCGKTSVLAISLLPMPKSSCAERTILVAKIPANTRVESNVAVLRGMCHESVLCVGVECAKTCYFITPFMAGTSFHQMEPKADMTMFYSGPPFSILRFSGKLHSCT